MKEEKQYPHSAKLRAIPAHHDNEVWFQSLGFSWQLFFYWSWFKCNDAGILDVNLIDFSRATGANMLEYNGFDNYVRTMNQDGLERVVLLANGRKIWYPFALFYMKGGVLNLSVSHDQDCYQKLLLEEIPAEYIAARFNIINEADFDMETFMENCDLKIRESVTMTTRPEELFPRSYITHIKIDDFFVPYKLFSEYFERLIASYPEKIKPRMKHASYLSYYKWIKAYPTEYETAIRWIDRPRDKDYVYPPLAEFFAMRWYLRDE